MRNLLRAAVAGSVAIVAVAASIVPAQAYYREATDARGDVQRAYCKHDAKHPVKLDILKYSATTVKSHGTWKLTLRTTVAKLATSRPFYDEELDYNVFERGHKLGDPALLVGAVNYGNGWSASASSVHGDYPASTVKVKTHGNEIALSGITLKPGKVYWVTMFTFVRMGRDKGCDYRDDAERRVTAVKTK